MLKDIECVQKHIDSTLPTYTESSGTVSGVEISAFAVSSVMLWIWVVTSSTSVMSTVCTARRPRRPRRPAAVHCDADTPTNLVVIIVVVENRICRNKFKRNRGITLYALYKFTTYLLTYSLTYLLYEFWQKSMLIIIFIQHNMVEKRKQYKLEGAHESAYLRQVLAFNAEKFRGSRDANHASIWTNF